MPSTHTFFLAVRRSQQQLRVLFLNQVWGLVMRKLKTINATLQTFDPALDTKLFFVFAKAIAHNLSVIRACAKQVGISDICRTEDPAAFSMQSFQTVDRLLFIHNPQVNCVVYRCSVEELSVQHVDAVDWVM